MGQSFTPTLSSIDFVFLQIDDYNWNNGTGAVVFVRLFSGSLSIWRIKTTLAHRHGRAALLRRLLADPQVSPTKLAVVPMLIETAIDP